MSEVDPRPCVMHVVYRFDTGGLENGIVNLLNRMPAERFRHVVVALTEVTGFRHRVQRPDVEFIALHKPPGHGIWLYPRLYRLFRQWKPAIVHTRNLAALEAVVPAWAAGVQARVHGEHGRDVEDPDGKSKRHQWIRRLYRPFVTDYIALSRDLAGYLEHRVGVPARCLTLACNGVDTLRFAPAEVRPAPIAGCPFDPRSHWIIGTVGRMQTVKDQPLLARAFVLLLEREPAWRATLRLAMIGDGPLREEAWRILDNAGLGDLAWLPGERHDVADVMRGLNCFVLPSRAEGISNTILEAMASGLPVIATSVGGNAELVTSGRSGLIVPSGDSKALADAMRTLAGQATRAAAMGCAGRADAEIKFSMEAMVSTYLGVYQRALQRDGRRHAG